MRAPQEDLSSYIERIFNNTPEYQNSYIELEVSGGRVSLYDDCDTSLKRIGLLEEGTSFLIRKRDICDNKNDPKNKHKKMAKIFRYGEPRYISLTSYNLRVKDIITI